MSTLLSVVVFIAIGGLIGFLGSRLFEGSSLLIDILLGLVGAFGFSWLASLLGLGSGFMTFSLWGLVTGIAGAFLLVAVYGLIQRRLAKR